MQRAVKATFRAWARGEDAVLGRGATKCEPCTGAGEGSRLADSKGKVMGR